MEVASTWYRTPPLPAASNVLGRPFSHLFPFIYWSYPSTLIPCSPLTPHSSLFTPYSSLLAATSLQPHPPTPSHTAVPRRLKRAAKPTPSQPISKLARDETSPPHPAFQVLLCSTKVLIVMRDSLRLLWQRLGRRGLHVSYVAMLPRCPQKSCVVSLLPT